MDNPHVVCLSKLFDESRLVSVQDGSDKKNILIVVDKSLASEELAKLTRFFTNTAAVKFIDVLNLDKG